MDCIHVGRKLKETKQNLKHNMTCSGGLGAIHESNFPALHSSGMLQLEAAFCNWRNMLGERFAVASLASHGRFACHEICCVSVI